MLPVGMDGIEGDAAGLWSMALYGCMFAWGGAVLRLPTEEGVSGACQVASVHTSAPGDLGMDQLPVCLGVLLGGMASMGSMDP